jgi:hypothetical protein
MRYLGTITADATTAKTNGNTASTFTVGAGKVLWVQPDAACYVAPVTASDSVITAATTAKYEANALVPLETYDGTPYVCVLSVSGTANVKVFWRLSGE